MALAAPLARTATAAPRVTDKGTLKTFVGDRAVGVEAFQYQAEADTIVVTSELYQSRTSSSGPDTLRKSMTLVLGAFDLQMRFYDSVQRYAGHTLRRSVVPRESTFTAFFDLDNGGEGRAYTLPAGHFYVLDSGLFSLFDVMGRMLHGRPFQKRSIMLFTLGQVDSLIEASVSDLGTETVRWGAKPVQARKLEFSDGGTRFLVWTGPDGRMLRLEQPESRMRVERDPPPVRPRKRSAP